MREDGGKRGEASAKFSLPLLGICAINWNVCRAGHTARIFVSAARQVWNNRLAWCLMSTPSPILGRRGVKNDS
jgi:hypothetical protein